MKSLCILITVPCMLAWNNSEVRKLSIDQAINEKLITVKAVSNGNYSLGSVNFSVTNKSADKLIVSIPPGYVFYPNDPSQQSLITTSEQLLAVSPQNTQSKLLNAFCSEASDGAPSELKGFTFGKTKNSNLQKLADYTNSHPVSPEVLQDAVWAVSDGRSVTNIVTKTPEDKNLRKFVSTLTGQKDTWYTSPQNYRLNETRNIVSETVKVLGNINFTIPQTSVCYQEVRNKEGVVKFKSQKTMTLPKGEIGFYFNLKVTGWEKGKYDVFIISEADNKTVAKYNFEV